MKSISISQCHSRLHWLGLVTLVLACIAPPATAVPAIPEPPMVLLGTVTDAATNQAVAITSIVWQVTDGTVNKSFNAASTPATRVVNDAGQSFYILEVPFEVRSVQTPGGPSSLTASNGFDLKTNSPTYTLTATVNGRTATIKSVSGTAQPANTTTYNFSNYTPSTQGQMLRVDLTLPVLDAYADWATLHFPNPNAPEAAKSADPDGDGAANEQEYLAGTNPNSASSVLSITGSSINANGSWSVSFQTVPGKKYRLLSSTDLTAFNPEGATFTATSNTTDLTLGNGFRKFIKLEIVPE